MGEKRSNQRADRRRGQQRQKSGTNSQRGQNGGPGSSEPSSGSETPHWKRSPAVAHSLSATSRALAAAAFSGPAFRLDRTVSRKALQQAVTPKLPTPAQVTPKVDLSRTFMPKGGFEHLVRPKVDYAKLVKPTINVRALGARVDWGAIAGPLVDPSRLLAPQIDLEAVLQPIDFSKLIAPRVSASAIVMPTLRATDFLRGVDAAGLTRRGLATSQLLPPTIDVAKLFGAMSVRELLGPRIDLSRFIRPQVQIGKLLASPMDPFAVIGGEVDVDEFLGRAEAGAGGSEHGGPDRALSTPEVQAIADAIIERVDELFHSIEYQLGSIEEKLSVECHAAPWLRRPAAPIPWRGTADKPAGRLRSAESRARAAVAAECQG